MYNRGIETPFLRVPLILFSALGTRNELSVNASPDMSRADFVI